MPAFQVTYRIRKASLNLNLQREAILTGTVEVFGAHASEARASAVRTLSDRGAVTIMRVTQVR